MTRLSDEGVRELGFVVFAVAARGGTWARLYAVANGDVRVLAKALTLARQVDPSDWRRSVPLGRVLDSLLDALEAALHAKDRRLG